MSLIYPRLQVMDELLMCMIRAVKRANGMPVINESNLVATCDHLINLIEETREQLKLAREEVFDEE